MRALVPVRLAHRRASGRRTAGQVAGERWRLPLPSVLRRTPWSLASCFGCLLWLLPGLTLTPAAAQEVAQRPAQLLGEHLLSVCLEAPYARLALSQAWLQLAGVPPALGWAALAAAARRRATTSTRPSLATPSCPKTCCPASHPCAAPTAMPRRKAKKDHLLQPGLSRTEKEQKRYEKHPRIHVLEVRKLPFRVLHLLQASSSQHPAPESAGPLAQPLVGAAV